MKHETDNSKERSRLLLLLADMLAKSQDCQRNMQEIRELLKNNAERFPDLDEKFTTFSDDMVLELTQMTMWLEQYCKETRQGEKNGKG
jgi:hypothetical protein